MGVMAYNNWDREEGTREQNKEKQQGKIMTVTIGKVLVTEKMSKT